MLIAHLDDLELLTTARCLQDHLVAGTGLQQRPGEWREPADLIAIEIDFVGEPDLEQARQIADKLLANPVIEEFTIRVEEPAPAVRS